MPNLRKVTDINHFTDGTYITKHIRAVYCLVGFEDGQTSDNYSYCNKYDLMGLPFTDDSNNLHFTIIDYDENKHEPFLYIDYDGYGASNTKKEQQQQIMNAKLEDGSISLSERFIPDYTSSQSTKKRKLTNNNTGGKTRKKRG